MAYCQYQLFSDSHQRASFLPELTPHKIPAFWCDQATMQIIRYCTRWHFSTFSVWSKSFVSWRWVYVSAMKYWTLRLYASFLFCAHSQYNVRPVMVNISLFLYYDFIIIAFLFFHCSSGKNCPSAWCASASGVCSSDGDVFRTKTVALNHILYLFLNY